MILTRIRGQQLAIDRLFCKMASDEHSRPFHVGVTLLGGKEVPRIGKNCLGDASCSLECNVFLFSLAGNFYFEDFREWSCRSGWNS